MPWKTTLNWKKSRFQWRFSIVIFKKNLHFLTYNSMTFLICPWCLSNIAIRLVSLALNVSTFLLLRPIIYAKRPVRLHFPLHLSLPGSWAAPHNLSGQHESVVVLQLRNLFPSYTTQIKKKRKYTSSCQNDWGGEVHKVLIPESELQWSHMDWLQFLRR